MDPTNIDLTEFDVVRALRGGVGLGSSLAARAADLATNRATNLATNIATNIARDATYVTVGMGLLGYQRAQVRRREFERSRRH